MNRLTTVRVRNDASKNSINTHREKAREYIKTVNIKRIEFEKKSLESIQKFQTNIKQIVNDDIQLIKQLFSKDE